MGRGGYVYIMTNIYLNVLYTGVTSELRDRVYQHKNNCYPNSFASKYKCYKLVYYYFFDHIEEAINEEKRIKAGNRKAKINLIESINPQFSDLFENLD